MDVNWKLAPPEANWYAVDSSGFGCYYIEEPFAHLGRGVWATKTRNGITVDGMRKIPSNWTKAIAQRPKNKSRETEVKIEEMTKLINSMAYYINSLGLDDRGKELIKKAHNITNKLE